MINCVTVTGEGVNSEQVPMRIIVQHSGKLANGLMILPTQQSNKKCIEINSIDLETSALSKAGLTPRVNSVNGRWRAEFASEFKVLLVD